MDDPLTWIRAVHFAATLALAGAAIFGAVIAGPFDIAERDLTSMVSRVVAAERAVPRGSETVH